MWWRNRSLLRTDKLKHMIERHKKYIKWWKNFLKVSLEIEKKKELVDLIINSYNENT